MNVVELPAFKVMKRLRKPEGSINPQEKDKSYFIFFNKVRPDNGEASWGVS